MATVTKQKDGVYRVDYKVNGRRRRKRIGTNKAQATSVLAQIQADIINGRYFEREQDENLRLQDLIDRFLEHTKDKKKSHRRDVNSADHLVEFMGETSINRVIPAMIEDYRAHRKTARTRNGKAPAPATINRELAFLKRVFSWGMQNEMISKNPARYVKLEKENNIRDRVLSEQEFQRLLEVSPLHLQQIMIVAYYTAMRKGEILGLRWDEVDFKAGLIRLGAGRTKTNEARRIPLAPEIVEMLREKKRSKTTPFVFVYAGEPIDDVKTSFGTARRAAGLEDFRFHDFRHTAITNWRRAGHDFFTIMAATGHTTMSVFQRYNTISDDDLHSLISPPAGQDGSDSAPNPSPSRPAEAGSSPKASKERGKPSLRVV
jgi:integrase